MKSVFTLFLLTLVTVSYCQSKWQYGIHIGANYSKTIEDGIVNGSPIDVLEHTRLVTPSIGSGVGYLFNDRFRLKSGATINWLDSKRKSTGVRFSSLYIEVPLEASHRVYKNLRVMAGVSYNYLVNFSTVVEGDAFQANFLVDKDHILNIKTGLSYSFGKYLEVGLSYNQHTAKYLDYDILSLAGDVVGRGSARNDYFQLACYFRG